jgi:PAS domain-containing protein
MFGIIVCDSLGKIISFNPTASVLLACSAESACGRHINQFIKPTEVAALSEKAGCSAEQALFVRHSQGEPVVEENLTLVTGAGIEVTTTLSISIARDVSNHALLYCVVVVPQ